MCIENVAKPREAVAILQRMVPQLLVVADNGDNLLRGDHADVGTCLLALADQHKSLVTHTFDDDAL
jgi:hypothetical protein